MRMTPYARRKNSLTPAEKRRFKNWYPVPGWRGDPQPRFGKFERWQKRPDAAQRLYWVTHPELYAKMTERQETALKDKVAQALLNSKVN